MIIWEISNTGLLTTPPNRQVGVHKPTNQHQDWDQQVKDMGNWDGRK